MLPQVIDNSHALSANEHIELVNYLIENCRTGIRDMEWLGGIIIRDDGGTNYLGYWQARVERVQGHVKAYTALIVLNSYYLRSLASMLRTLAHEYGHHWTLSYLVWCDHFEAERNIFVERAPWAYYRIRRLDPAVVKADVNLWDYCDKEILAEDYRCLFTTASDPHRMKSLFGSPSSEVRDYIGGLCYSQRYGIV